MSDILLGDISPEGVEVTSCITYGYPGDDQNVEITAHRIGMPTGIGPARVIRLTVAREMFIDGNRPNLLSTLRGRVEEAFRE